MGLIALLFVVLPILEVASIVWVAHQVGIAVTIVLLFAVSFFGARLAKRMGLGVWRRFRAARAAGQLPSGEVFDGVLILLAGICFVIPGFLTDALGVALLLAPVRALVKRLVWRRMRRRMGDAAGLLGGRLGRPVRVEAVRLIDQPTSEAHPGPPSALRQFDGIDR